MDMGVHAGGLLSVTGAVHRGLSPHSARSLVPFGRRPAGALMHVLCPSRS